MERRKFDVANAAEEAKTLKAGEMILLSGTVYTARDAAHKRMMALLDEEKELPFPIKGAAIYYAGPTPAPEGMPIGSCGPTTSGRMDPFAPRLLDLGQSVMIGKGNRSQAVIDAMKRNGAVYLCAIGGAGALAAKAVKSCEVIAFEDLGCESVKRLQVENFPLIVAIDAQGNSIFAS
ncbi:MAG: Fe-S-containing hydro-lyase [Acutalibacteraceae bacterium]|jgi:fumarate hydratase subunit beta